MTDEPDLSVLAAHLREARKARRKSQEEAAKWLNMSRPTFIAIEQGRRPPRPEELVRLAQLYGRSMHELVRSSPPVQALAASFRLSDSKDEPADAVHAAVSDLERLAEDAMEIEQLSRAPMSRNYPVEYELEGLPPDLAAEQIADAERRRLGLGDGPVLNLRSLLEGEVGLKVFIFSLPRRVAGLFAVADPAGACIGINADHPKARRRWSLAHEYAHFLTTRWTPEILPAFGVSNRGTERFADAFAARFLMPSTSVTRRFQSVRRSRGAFTPADLLQLAAEYEVSAQAMALRLEDLGLVAGGWWDGLRNRGLKVHEAQSRLGLKLVEKSPDLLPQRIKYLAVEAYLHESLSEGRLADFLRSDRATARDVVEELTELFEMTREGDVQSWLWDPEPGDA